MCDSPDVVNLAGILIEEMPIVSVLTLANRMLGPKSQVSGKDRLVVPLSLKPRDERSLV
jgi:hypothetical protein